LGGVKITNPAKGQQTAIAKKTCAWRLL
jgi:hypothetical protein